MWQTLLGGKMPFSTPRFRGGAPLDEFEINDLKSGKHHDLASTYNIVVDPEEFSRLNGCDELQMEIYEAPDDNVNGLLIAMATESLQEDGQPSETPKPSVGIPKSELPVLVSALQMCLSSSPIHRKLESVRILLG